MCMRLSGRTSKLLVLTGFVFVAACTTEKRVEKKPVYNNDIANAIEISIDGYSTNQSNTGYGDLMELKAVSNSEDQPFEEINSAWYKLVIPDTLPDNTLLSFTLDPKNETEDYDFLIYKYTGENFIKEIAEGNLLPVRTNLAKNNLSSGSSTGLSCEARNEFEGAYSDFPFSKSLLVNKNEVYYLVTNTATAEGKGYIIRFSTCYNEGSAGNAKEQAQTSQEWLESSEPASSVDAFSNSYAKPVKKKYVELPLNEGEEYYTVEPKNTVYSTATTHGMTVEELMALNNLESYHIEVGQRLKVRRRYAQDEAAEATPSSARPASVPAKAQPAAVASSPASATNGKPAGTQATKASAKANLTNTPSMVAADIENAPPVTVAKVPRRTSGVAAATTAEAQNKVAAEKEYYIYLHVYNANTSKLVNTTVKLIDSKNPKRFSKIPTNRVVPVSVRENESKSKILVCDPFGYRKKDFDLNLDKIINDTTASYTTIYNDTIVVKFEMERYKKKDIVVMYNVFFYDDASVMLPISKHELESLLELMNENKKVKIRLHGHTNGNSMGKIIKLEEGDPNFFTVTARNKETYGSAVTLSKCRSESIKYYLMSNGISEDRVEIKGWGGKSPLYDKNDPLAYKNKRVEVEIVEDR